MKVSNVFSNLLGFLKLKKQPITQRVEKPKNIPEDLHDNPIQTVLKRLITKYSEANTAFKSAKTDENYQAVVKVQQEIAAVYGDIHKLNQEGFDPKIYQEQFEAISKLDQAFLKLDDERRKK